MKFIVSSEEELVQKIYEALSDKLQAPFKVALIGDLGAGKTTLVQGLLKKLGVEDTVTSPTFTICKSYKTDSANFQHLDLYRYSKGTEDKEIEEYVNDNEAISFVEWPENISYSLDNYNVVISLKALDSSKRGVGLKWN